MDIVLVEPCDAAAGGNILVSCFYHVTLIALDKIIKLTLTSLSHNLLRQYPSSIKLIPADFEQIKHVRNSRFSIYKKGE